MTSRFKSQFQNLNKQGRKAFIPFTLLGFPNRLTSLQIIKQMIMCGASALELGVSFSDPIADGPIIQNAAHSTLRSGFDLESAFDLLKEIRSFDQNIPIGILVYFNMVLARGVDKFFAHAKNSGVDGVLIADFPVESAGEILPAAKDYCVDPMFLISPVTRGARIDQITSCAGGFLYLVSRLGVTGITTRSIKKDQELTQLIHTIRAKTDLPICAGFGISSPADAAGIFSLGVDGVITGSRIIELIQNEEHPAAALSKFYREMARTCFVETPYEEQQMA